MNALVKTATYENHNRIIKWSEKGRIVHSDLAGKVISVEDYTKASLTKIIKFLERSHIDKTKRMGKLNRAAHDLFNGIDAFNVEATNDGFVARVSKDGSNKIHRTAQKGTVYQNHNVYLPVSQEWKTNMRYKIDIDNDGTIWFSEFEAINTENLNIEYAEPLLNVYETEI